MIEEITSPPFLDDTAQEIVTKLQAIANNINNNAGQVSYSNTSSQLQAETVQTAIDEVKGITDTISASLTNYAPLASPTFTGTPKAPTATSGTNTTQIATTAFVKTATDAKLNSNVIRRYLDGSAISTPSKITMSSSIKTFSNGECNVPFSEFGATSRPDVLILTCQSQACAMEYVYDSSSSSVKLKLVGNSTSGAVRFCWICVIW